VCAWGEVMAGGGGVVGDGVLWAEGGLESALRVSLALSPVLGAWVLRLWRQNTFSAWATMDVREGGSVCRGG